MAAPRILVVEDDRYFLGVLRDYLGYLGLEVREASDGEDGWTEFAADPPDLVLSDVLLPRLNGLELAARIKSSGHDAPVLLMSAVYKDAETVERNLRQCGADGYLIKPFSMPDLRTRLAELLPAVAPESVADEPSPITGDELSMVKYRSGLDLPREGEISAGFLAPLLLQLRAVSHTGVLMLRDGKRWKDIVLLNGHAVWADGGAGSDRLGTMLLEDGVIAQEQFADAVAYMREESVDFGSALTDRRILTPTDLYTQLRRLVERRVIGAFAWNVGTWSLTNEFPRQTSSFETRPLAVVWRGLSTHGKSNAMEEEITPLRFHYVVPTGRFDADFAEIKKEDGIGFLGSFLNGCRTVQHLSEMEILEPGELTRALWLMYRAGMIGFGQHASGDEEGLSQEDTTGPPTLELPELRGSLTESGEAIIHSYLRLWQADFFQIFGLEPTASESEIAAALKTNPLGFDPGGLSNDLPGDVRSKAKALEEWIGEARATLSDPGRRAAYANRFQQGLTGIYRKVSKARETEAAMFFEMGKAFIQTREYREAEMSFAKAVERSPETAEYVAYQGWASYRKAGGDGGATRARELIDRSLDMDDHLSIAWYFSGIIHRDQRHYRDAISAFEAALSFDTHFEAARKALQQTSEIAQR
ncbi:MAG: response regulator [Proteobacteria bacterium]|nr:response regulator [Pseudomonadota bacterium]